MNGERNKEKRTKKTKKENKMCEKKPPIKFKTLN